MTAPTALLPATVEGLRTAVAGRPIPALSVRQPWLTAILAGVKTVENRTWPPLTFHAGWIWLHESAKPDPAGRDFVRLHGQPEWADIRPVAGIIAAAYIGGVCQPRQQDCACGVWAWPACPYHWQISAVVRLPDRVVCGGRLRLWWPDQQLRNQLAAALNQEGPASDG